MDRPPAVVRFETLSLIACLLNLAASLSGGHHSIGAILGAILGVALTLWVSRGRSRPGRTINTALFVLGLLVVIVGAAVMARTFTTGFGLTMPIFGITLLALALNVVALGNVWSKDATAWLRRETQGA